jgi:hypothetical protein
MQSMVMKISWFISMGLGVNADRVLDPSSVTKIRQQTSAIL